MGIFDIFDIIEAIIEPTSDYEEMLDKIKSNKEGTINDCESVEPEDDFNSLLMDIKDDFDDDSEADDTEGIISDDTE